MKKKKIIYLFLTSVLMVFAAFCGYFYKDKNSPVVTKISINAVYVQDFNLLLSSENYYLAQIKCPNNRKIGYLIQKEAEELWVAEREKHCQEGIPIERTSHWVLISNPVFFE